MPTPMLDDVFIKEIKLVEYHQDLGNGRDEIDMDQSNETLNSSEEGFLVLLRSNQLHHTSLECGREWVPNIIPWRTTRRM